MNIWVVVSTSPDDMGGPKISAHADQTQARVAMVQRIEDAWDEVADHDATTDEPMRPEGDDEVAYISALDAALNAQRAEIIECFDTFISLHHVPLEASAITISDDPNPPEGWVPTDPSLQE